MCDPESVFVVFTVQSEHWYYPGEPLSAYRTIETANKEAANIVNILRKDVELPQTATADNWQQSLAAARRKRAKDLECDVDDLGDSGADVWIDKLRIMP
jgi:hypothetical protein